MKEPESGLAARIRDLRLAQGLTLEYVAERVGVGKSTVRKWETGLIANMRRDKIAKLAYALNTTPGHLMGWEQVEQNPAPALEIEQPAAVACTPTEEALLHKLRQLNPEGQQKVEIYIDDLIRAGIYKKHYQNTAV